MTKWTTFVIKKASNNENNRDKSLGVQTCFIYDGNEWITPSEICSAMLLIPFSYFSLIVWKTGQLEWQETA